MKYRFLTVMSRKSRILVFTALWAVFALLSVYAGIVADEPMHRLDPDPECAICQATSGLAVVILALVIPSITPQILQDFIQYIKIQPLPSMATDIFIRGPPSSSQAV